MKHLYESIFDDDILDQDNVDELLIKKWISDNFYIHGYIQGNYKLYKKDGEYIIDSREDDVIVKNSNIESLNNNGMFKWGVVLGFDCYNCKKLKSLEGAPKYVIGDFSCSYCDVKSLEGTPEYVGGNFHCYECKKLKSLKGAPKEVGENFNCSYCVNLESLEGSPKKIDGHFNCSHCDKLKNFKGCPEYMGSLACVGCKNLKLDYIKHVHDIMHFTGCPNINLSDDEIIKLTNCKKIMR